MVPRRRFRFDASGDVIADSEDLWAMRDGMGEAIDELNSDLTHLRSLNPAGDLQQVFMFVEKKMAMAEDLKNLSTRMRLCRAAYRNIELKLEIMREQKAI